MTARDPAAWYRQQAEQSAVRADAAGAHARRIGHYRLAAFAVAVAGAVWVITAPPHQYILPRVVLLLGIGAFAMLVVYHRRARLAHAALLQRRRYHELAGHRLERDWAALPLPPHGAVIAPDHPYAADLDITGRGSLMQLLDVVSAAPGRRTLLRWLLDPPPSPSIIAARQGGARELAARDDIRVELGVTAHDVGELDPTALDRFVAWCELPGSLLEHPFAIWSARITALLIVGGIVLQAAGVLAQPYWLAVVILGRIVRSGTRRLVADGAPLLPAVQLTALRSHRAMFDVLEHATFDSPALAQYAALLRTAPGAASQLARLERVASWVEVRHSPMLHFALDWLLLWDLHVAVALERWRRDAGQRVREWMDALGSVEALSALGTLAHDQPDWAFPSLDDTGATMLEASALGHPLLPNASRVANDVTVGPPGTFLLVTGSNMSGKSTLLRAIGVNAVLAQAGGPVCASRYRSHRLSIETSIRVEDSLTGGVSLFMAELRRIKRIVDSARARDGRPPVLYLLDEILHGTNSAERRVAARTVIAHLLDAGAIGVVTTHDLTLAADGPIARAARPVSFAESVDRSTETPTLHFDYRLRDGLATSSNALALLEIVGLGPPA